MRVVDNATEALRAMTAALPSLPSDARERVLDAVDHCGGAAGLVFLQVDVGPGGGECVARIELTGVGREVVALMSSVERAASSAGGAQ